MTKARLNSMPKKIKKMKDNNSHLVDGIPSKLLKEIVKKISTPLTNVFKWKQKSCFGDYAPKLVTKN